MLHKNHISQAQIEALLDGELAKQERDQVEDHVDSCDLCQGAIHQYQAEQALWTEAFRGQIDDAAQQIDWDAFNARVMSQVSTEDFSHNTIAAPCPSTPIQQTTPTPGWFAQMVGWLKAHPGFLIASAATAGILLLFALPALDPGPSKKDVIVERVIKSKTAKVSVLHSTNQTTGHSMTVIVVNEPPTERPQKRTRIRRPKRKATSSRTRP